MGLGAGVSPPVFKGAWAYFLYITIKKEWEKGSPKVKKKGFNSPTDIFLKKKGFSRVAFFLPLRSTKHNHL